MPTRKRHWWIFAALGIALLLATWLGLLFIFVVWPMLAPAPNATRETPAEKHAATLDAFTKTTSPLSLTDPTTKNILAGLEAFNTAAKTGDGKALLNAFDLDRMMQVLQERGAIARASQADRRDFLAGVRRGLERAGPGWNRVSYQRLEPRLLRPLAPDDVIVYAKQTSGDFSTRMRWWLKRRGVAWRIYDYEELDSGSRYTALIDQTIRDTLDHKPWVTRATALAEATTLVNSGSYWKAAEKLQTLDTVEFPPAFDAVRRTIKASCFVNTGRPKDALVECDAVTRESPDFPVALVLQARAHLGLKDYAQALADVEKHQAILGPDATASSLAGQALEHAGDKPKALAWFRRGVQENPDNAECQLGVLRTTDQQDEVGRLFARAHDHKIMYSHLGAAMIHRQDAAGLAALNAAYAADQPADELLDYYQAEVFAMRQDFRKAADLLRPLLGTTSKNRRAFLDEFLLASTKVDGTLKAYDACPDAVFALNYFSWTLIRNKDYATLESILASHATRAPDDPTGYRVLADLRQAQDRWPDADAALREGAKRALDADSQETFRWRRVNARYHLGDVLGAYRDIPPNQETFEQLAGRLETDKRTADLENLLAVHQAKHPRAVETLYYQTQVKWLRQDYVGVLGAIEQIHLSTAEESRYSYQFNNLKLRSLLRLNSLDAALRVAQDMSEKRTHTWPLLLAHAAAGHVDETLAIIKTQLTDDEDTSVADLYADEDLARALKTPSMKTVRDKYPEPPPQTLPAGD